MRGRRLSFLPATRRLVALGLRLRLFAARYAASSSLNFFDSSNAARFASITFFCSSYLTVSSSTRSLARSIVSRSFSTAFFCVSSDLSVALFASVVAASVSRSFSAARRSVSSSFFSVSRLLRSAATARRASASVSSSSRSLSFSSRAAARFSSMTAAASTSTFAASFAARSSSTRRSCSDIFCALAASRSRSVSSRLRFLARSASACANCAATSFFCRASAFSRSAARRTSHLGQHDKPARWVVCCSLGAPLRVVRGFHQARALARSRLDEHLHRGFVLQRELALLDELAVDGFDVRDGHVRGVLVVAEAKDESALAASGHVGDLVVGGETAEARGVLLVDVRVAELDVPADARRGGGSGTGAGDEIRNPQSGREISRGGGIGGFSMTHLSVFLLATPWRSNLASTSKHQTSVLGAMARGPSFVLFATPRGVFCPPDVRVRDFKVGRAHLGNDDSNVSAETLDDSRNFRTSDFSLHALRAPFSGERRARRSPARAASSSRGVRSASMTQSIEV